MSRPSTGTRGWRAVAAAGAVLLGGCGLFGQDDPTVDGPVRTLPATPTVTLLDAGAEPRRAMALTLRPDSTADLRFAVDLHVTQRGTDEERSQVLEPPATIQTVRFTVVAADPSGADLTFEVLDAAVDPAGTTLTDQQIWSLTAALQEVVGLRGAIRLGRRGLLESVRYEVPDGMAPDAAAALDDLEGRLATVVPALPAEPIGRGARWRTVTRTELAGVVLRQTTTYEVTGIDGDRLLYRATIAQTAVEQTVDETAGPSGTVRLLAADLTGTATGMFSLRDLASQSDTTLTGHQVLEQVVGDGTSRLTQDLEISVVVAPPG